MRVHRELHLGGFYNNLLLKSNIDLRIFTGDHFLL